MNCPSCGHKNRDAARFCDECGRPVELQAPVPERDPRGYTPRHLVEKILRSRSAMEGEHKQVTVFFADVKSSVELSRAVGDEQWHEILDGFFRILSEGVHRFEGTVNQYTGDGVMALFGAPIAHEDHARRACHAALYLRDELGHYAAELRSSRGLDFAVRMGLHSGDVVVGKIGDDLRMDYTAQGHCVGVAARLQQRAEPGTILLSDKAASMVEGYFVTQPVGEAELEGVEEPIETHELTGTGPLRTRLDASRLRGFSKFVGRADELQTLESALGVALRGRGRIVGVVAQAGEGKSRLCYEFAESCRSRGIPVFEAHGLAHGRQMPMLPMLELLRSFFGIKEGDPDRLAREKISTRLRDLDEDLATEEPLVFDLLGVPDPAQPLAAIDPEAHRQRILDTIRRMLIAQREPAVLMIDDLHWLDSASNGILAQIVEVTSESGGLVVVNFRPEYRAAWTVDPHYQQIDLEPLAAHATHELLEDLLGDDPSVSRLAKLVESRTRGNPFFIEEVVQMLVDTRALFGSRGAWRLARPVEELEVPETVRAVLAARIDRLAERDKRVLQTSAVIGKRVPFALLCRVSDLPERELEASLSALGDAEFLHEVEAGAVEYAFKHALTEAVAYESQLREPRSRLHAEVARAIEALAPDRLDEQAAPLAYHCNAAGKGLEAAQWHRRAAEWIGLAEPSEALRHWREVRRLARKQDSRVAAELLGLSCYQTLNFGWRIGLADDEMRSAVAECRDISVRLGDPALIVRVLCAYAVCLNFRGAARENIAQLTEALELARAQRSTDMEVDVLLTLQDSFWILGRLREADEHCTRAIELVGEDAAHTNFGGTSSYLESLAKRGGIRAERGLHSEALEDLELALRLSERSLDENLLFSLMVSVRSAELSGGLDQCRARALRLSEVALRSGSPLWTLHASLCAGVAQLANEQWSEAIGLLERVVERIDERGLAPVELGRTLTALAQAYQGGGRLTEATKAAERAVRTCRTRGMKSWECRARLVLARVRIANEGAPARRKVRVGLKKCEELVDETDALAYRPLVCEARAELARRADDADAVESELREAHRLFTEMGATHHAERVARELAE